MDDAYALLFFVPSKSTPLLFLFTSVPILRKSQDILVSCCCCILSILLSVELSICLVLHVLLHHGSIQSFSLKCVAFA